MKSIKSNLCAMPNITSIIDKGSYILAYTSDMVYKIGSHNEEGPPKFTLGICHDDHIEMLHSSARSIFWDKTDVLEKIDGGF